MTLFINSDCTEGLLQQKGYYWIDTRELGNSLIVSIEDNFGIITYHLLGAYINHNYRSYLHFYDLTGDDIDLNTYCKDCIGKIYYMTHDLYTILKEVIGGSFAELVIEQELNIFDENNDITRSLTFGYGFGKSCGIEREEKKRKKQTNPGLRSQKDLSWNLSFSTLNSMAFGKSFDFSEPWFPHL